MKFWLLSVLLLPSLVQAQVYKCEKDGRTIYSDDPCGPNGQVLRNLKRNTLPAAPVEQQQTVQRRFQPQNQQEAPTQAQTQAFVANQTECDRARRNAATTASSLTAKKSTTLAAERDANIVCYGSERAAQIEAARAGAPRITIQNQPARVGPLIITHCAASYCYDNQGGTHFMPGR